MTKPDFLALNKRQEAAGEQMFANPRNSAAGSLRQKDSSVTASRPLHFFAYGWGQISAMPAESQSAMLKWFAGAGFVTNPLTKICRSVEDLVAFHRDIAQRRAKLEYDIDGVVYKVDRLEDAELLTRMARLAAGTGLTISGLYRLGLSADTAKANAMLSEEVGRRQALALRCRVAASRLETALRKAVRSSERRLADGSLFVPAALLDGAAPFQQLTASRDGSYWNLVVPYALASGFFPPHGAQATGLLRYLMNHGSRLLGLVRAGAYRLAGSDASVSGTDEVYGVNVARFLSDAD